MQDVSIQNFPMNSIDEAFVKEGYVSIPFSFNGAGHPIISATFANNMQANILLDTGASANLLDQDFARSLALDLVSTGEKGGGAGGLIHDVFSIGEIEIGICGRRFKFDNFLAMDFSSIRLSLSSNGITEEFQGILGFGFFKMTKCFIDYHSNRLFVDSRSL